MNHSKKISLALACLLLTGQSQSADHLMVIGAGGEAHGKVDTIFDGAIKNVGDYVKRTPGLKVDVALNGGHSSTEALIRDSFPTASTRSDFQASDYQRLIQSYKQKLEKNEITSGDQLMIFVDSHGAQKEDRFKTHQIATSGSGAANLNTLAGASVVDLDQLEVLKKLAKEKGVKMAIIDGSCHSGNTLALADDNTCVIAGTGPNHYGYGTFTQNFSNAMTKGKSLEEVFLDARAIDDTPGLPMISGQAGESVHALLYEKITPFLYHFDEKNDKLSPFLEENDTVYHQCLADTQFNSLMATINSIEELNTVSQKVLWWTNKTKGVDLTTLKELLSKYKSDLDLVKNKTRELGTGRLKREETFNVKEAHENYRTDYSRNYSWKEMMTSDYPTLIAQLQERMNSETDDLTITSYKGTMSLYRQAKAKKEEILRNDPDLASIPAKEAEIKKLIDSTYFTNRNIAIEERKLYSALYKNAQKTQVLQKPNPCQNFKL